MSFNTMKCVYLWKNSYKEKYMNDFFKSLPSSLPKNEPYYYLSKAQATVCLNYPILRPYITHLPCWVPHRRIADALGFSYKGIENALIRCNGIPYVWGTEFENVHSTWIFNEPPLEIEGRYYRCSESYYQAQKPQPYNDELWKTQRDDVMRTAISPRAGWSCQ